MGATVVIERAVPCWGGVRLRGLRARLVGVESVGIAVDEVEIRWGLGGRRVVVRGGRVSAIGPRSVLLDEVGAWRARRPSGSTGGGGGSQLELGGLEVSWKDRETSPTEELTAREVRVERLAGGLTVTASAAVLSFGATRVQVADGRVELAIEGAKTRLRGLSASAIDGEVRLGAAETTGDVGGALVPSAGSAAPVPAREAGLGARAARVREQALRAIRAVDGALEPNAKVDLGGLRARIHVGDDVLNLGPGVFGARRDGGRLILELSPSAGQASSVPGEQVLSFSLSAPVGGEAGDIVADVRGGPIGLATLGIREGDFGLLDVGRTALDTRSHLVLSADGRRFTVEGEGRLHGLSIRNAAMSDEPVRGLELAWRARGEAMLDGSKLRLEEGEIDLGAVRVKAHGAIEQSGDGRVVSGEVEVPLTACQSMLESIPRGLAPKLAGMRMAGSFGLRGRGQVDTGRLDRMRVDWDVSNSCRVTEAPPEVAVERFTRPFKHAAYGADGVRIELETGPGTPGWTALAATSRFMEVAVLTTEDGAFHRHHGFDEEAIRNSIRENLRKGRFVRGASTISMQLAKNLYLDRTKNLSRKLQEAVLTMYLEQELTKEQILELYFNVVELGSMVYGVGPAARHYFGTSAGELSLGQALYMASVLPNPKNQHFAAGGAVAPGWTRYLRKLMEVAHARKRISDDELAEGLRETVVRGSPSPRRAPRGDEVEGPDGVMEGDDAAP